MSPSATPSPSRGPRRGSRRDAQRGASLIITIALTGVLALLVVASLSFARSSATQTAREGRDDLAVQVADAGVNQYIARLVEDPLYHQRWVDRAEDPRIDQFGVVHPPGSPWPTGLTWTYAGPSQTWTQVQDARFGTASYSLRVQPGGPGAVTIQSTARVGGGGPNPLVRSIQSQVAPSSIADFQMVSNATIKYGSTARTKGKLYSAVDINHLGVAEQAAYAQRYACSNSGFSCSGTQISGSVYQGGALDSTTTPSFSAKFPAPIDFNQFTQSRLDIKDAATTGGTAYDDPTARAWLVQFLADGRAKVAKVTGSFDPGSALGTIACPVTINVPSNGAMYFEQSVVVSDGRTNTDSCGGAGPRPSVVNGRLTIATKGNVYVGGNISYATPGDDVLGLIAANEVIVAKYTPTNLTWRAASLAQSGQWRTFQSAGDGHQHMHYIGSQTTADGGYASMFATREYEYDTTLQSLRPPFYPIIEGSWNTIYWREVKAPA